MQLCRPQPAEHLAPATPLTLEHHAPHASLHQVAVGHPGIGSWLVGAVAEARRGWVVRRGVSLGCSADAGGGSDASGGQR